MMVTPLSVRTSSPADRALDVAALLDREIDDDRTRPHGGYLGGAHQPRGRAAGDERGGDDDVLTCAIVALTSSACFAR